jgi:uncharacterized protein (DUF427 family)
VNPYPESIARENHVAPAPRRVRGIAGGTVIFDTLRALYVWEWAQYPQYYLPREDVDLETLAASGAPHETPQGLVQSYALHAGTVRPAAARIVLESEIPGLTGTARFNWKSLDQWFEEDEEVFVHPRNPYTRVDALRSKRLVRVELDGIVLAESASCVMVFETGLPTRYYLDQRDVRFEHLVPSQTRTECPYKGRTTGYWAVRTAAATHPDLAWSYAFPSAAVFPIAGLVAFLNEKVDIFIGGVAVSRPTTHMS